MATSIHVSRKTKASKLSGLQADLEVWQVTVDLRGLLSTKALSLVTGADVLGELRVNYPAATLLEDPYRYWWVWSEALHEWVRYCLAAAVITILGNGGKEPILVTVEEQAQYGQGASPAPGT